MASEKITLDIKGGEADSHKVPVSLLVSMLTNLEDLFYLMANADEGISYDSRLRVTEETKQKYKFLCETPRTGSYSLPIEVESPERTVDLFTNSSESTALKFKNLISRKSSIDEYKKYFRTSKSRLKALNLTQAAFPPSDSKYYVDIISSNSTQNSRTIQKEVETLSEETQSELNDTPNFSILSGYLQKIDLKSNSIELLYPPTKRTFKCYYKTDEIADAVLKLAAEDKDRLLQISGDLTVNENDEPKELSNISSVNFMDESPVEISEFNKSNKRFYFKQPIRLVPHLDESKQLYLLEYPKLGLDISVFTRAELKDEIEEQLVFLWEEYAQESDDKLTTLAVELKNNINLLMDVEEL